MSLDRRLRDELQREAATIDPDAGRALVAVEARARRRASGGLGSLLAAAAAVVLIVVGLQALRPTPDPGPGGSVPPTVLPSPSPSTAEIAATYVATLEASDGGAQFADVAGEWTMELRPDGVMLMAPPATFREGSAPQSGAAYSIEGERFRSNLFQERCNSIGVYAWILDESVLTLTPVDDDCDLRPVVLASAPWTRR